TRFLQVRFGVLPALARFRPDVVVTGELGLRTVQACLYSRMTGTPFLIWSEITRQSEGWVQGRKLGLRRYLVRNASGFWVNGRESAEILLDYGADGTRVHGGIIGMDTCGLRGRVSARMPEREALRQALGVKGTVFLFAGQFIPLK